MAHPLTNGMIASAGMIAARLLMLENLLHVDVYAGDNMPRTTRKLEELLATARSAILSALASLRKHEGINYEFAFDEAFRHAAVAEHNLTLVNSLASNLPNADKFVIFARRARAATMVIVDHLAQMDCNRYSDYPSGSVKSIVDIRIAELIAVVSEDHADILEYCK